ncbi:filament-like plant protein 3 [Euphorbia lathyris]|uniref:filament-like plant protein 3 n=1 Tax=Euphorbia lathyris TaxID=212925 RepID=UPI00331449D4
MNDIGNDDDSFQLELEMDRRSWLWRRKSSEKSPAEIDASSFSSHSERFSDDQAYTIHNPQSPEITSKLVTGEETNDDVRSLGNKLSAALLNISAKENLIKQHAKVAEEAVSGWEKAEKELLTVKQQLEAATKKNLGLEDRVVHLDAALKECVRQLRQAREEQEQKISEAVARKTRQWESIKSELECKLVELQTQLQTTVAATSVDSDLKKKLEAAEEENSSLKSELLSQAEEIEIRIMERDLSIQAAETASKQHLECIKKVAKLEAECRRLKTIARKATPATDHQSLTASSSCSDSCVSANVNEFDELKNQKAIGRSLMVPAVEIDLMDDFLEMERLAALPGTETGSSYLEAGSLSEQARDVESPLKYELQVTIHRTDELEERLERLEEEKVEIQKLLSECQRKLEMSSIQRKEADSKLVELQAQLALANEAKQVVEKEIERTKVRREVAESQLLVAEAENKTLHSKVSLLDAEVIKEHALSAENAVKSRKLEEELSELKRQTKLQREVEQRRVEGSKIKQEKQLAEAASKFAECQKTILSLGRGLKSLATMEDFLIDPNESLVLTSEGLHGHKKDEQWRL